MFLVRDFVVPALEAGRYGNFLCWISRRDGVFAFFDPSDEFLLDCEEYAAIFRDWNRAKGRRADEDPKQARKRFVSTLLKPHNVVKYASPLPNFRCLRVSAIYAPSAREGDETIESAVRRLDSWRCKLWQERERRLVVVRRQQQHHQQQRHQQQHHQQQQQQQEQQQQQQQQQQQTKPDERIGSSSSADDAPDSPLIDFPATPLVIDEDSRPSAPVKTILSVDASAQTDPVSFGPRLILVPPGHGIATYKL